VESLIHSVQEPLHCEHPFSTYGGKDCRVRKSASHQNAPHDEAFLEGNERPRIFAGLVSAMYMGAACIACTSGTHTEGVHMAHTATP